MVPVVAALLLRKSRSGYSFVFVCLFVHGSIFVGVYAKEEGEIIRMERVREHVTLSLEESKTYLQCKHLFFRIGWRGFWGGGGASVDG